MRAERQKIKLLEEGGASEEDILAAKARYKSTSHEYSQFSKAMKLPQQRQRDYTRTFDKNRSKGYNEYNAIKTFKQYQFYYGIEWGER